MGWSLGADPDPGDPLGTLGRYPILAWEARLKIPEPLLKRLSQPLPQSFKGNHLEQDGMKIACEWRTMPSRCLHQM